MDEKEKREIIGVVNLLGKLLDGKDNRKVLMEDLKRFYKESSNIVTKAFDVKEEVIKKKVKRQFENQSSSWRSKMDAEEEIKRQVSMLNGVRAEAGIPAKKQNRTFTKNDQ